MKKKQLEKIIEKHYLHHGVHVRLKLHAIIMNNERLIFQIIIKPGTRVQTVFDRASDIRMALGLPLFQPFIDKETIFLAISEKLTLQNSLENMLKSREFLKSRKELPIAIGYNLWGKMVFADLAQMPHALYAGSTNSGKSGGLICLITSLIIKQAVREVNLVLFDIGANSLDVFNGVPHLSYPIVKDVYTGIYVIKSLVEEMELRIKMDKKERQNKPAIVCVIDEFSSFINSANGKKISQKLIGNISTLLQKGRHAKIYMALSAQDPSKHNMQVDISNITTRMAFKCAKPQNSITVLGEGGAEKLSGKGTMLYKSNDYPNPIYLPGAYVSEEEVIDLVDCIKSIEYDLSNKYFISPFELLDHTEPESEDSIRMNYPSKELADIIIWTIRHHTISIKQIMEQFQMGNRASAFIDQLFEMGLVSDKFSKQPRKVLPQSIDDLSEDVLKFLGNNGYSVEDVSRIFSERPCN